MENLLECMDAFLEKKFMKWKHVFHQCETNKRYFDNIRVHLYFCFCETTGR